MVVIVLCISLPFCYVIVHRNICRNPSSSVAKSLCHRRRQLDTPFSLYVSDSIVSFILNRIVSIDPMATTTATIGQSHHQPMGLLMYQIVLFLVSIITILLLIFESNCIDRSDDNNNTNNSRIPSSTNGIVDVSDRPLPCVNNYHITFNIWIKSYQSIWWQQQQQQQFDNPIIDQWDCWCIRSSSSLCQ